MSFFYKISIDRVNANYISGWCFNRFDKTRRIKLECCSGSEIIGKTTADLLREDLRELGMHPDGRCGFEVVLQVAELGGSTGKIVIRPEGSGLKLAEISAHDFTLISRRSLASSLRSLIGSKKSGMKTIVFMHIPKTAGTSFNTLVRTLIPGGRIISHIELNDRADFRQLQEKQDYISGHVRIGVMKEHLILDRTEMYTIIREPYSQLHSHLRWLIQTATAEQDNYFKYNNPVIHHLGENLSEIDFSDIEALGMFVSNIRGVEAAFLENMQTRYFLDNEPDLLTDDDLRRALDNSELFRLIGLTEEYPAFVERFTRLNGLKSPDMTSRLNISAVKQLFDVGDPGVRDALLPLVRLDIELYNHVRKMWEEG